MILLTRFGKVDLLWFTWLLITVLLCTNKLLSVAIVVQSRFTYQVQSIEINIGEETYAGMPFVLRSGGNWIKNGSSDFYVEFSTSAKKVKKVVQYFNANVFLRSSSLICYT